MDIFKDFINGLESDLPEKGIEQPKIESEETSESPTGKKPQTVFVQKITTEVWVYTDTENKKLGSQTFQDLSVLGEMDFDAFTKLISKRKSQRRRRS